MLLETPLSAVRATTRALRRVSDRSLLFSFDRPGYWLHSAGFRGGDLDVDLGGRVCLVTGANSGIGKATAAALAKRGAEVWLLCRSLERAEAAAKEIRQAAGEDRVHVAELDVSDLDSVRRCAASLPCERVHVLVHNAGVLPAERIETAQGLELSFATNVVGPFLLTHLLLPRLRAGAPARVINVSSGGMYPSKLQLRDPEWKARRSYDGVTAYSEAKRAEVVLTEMWSKRLLPLGVRVNSMHPGWAETPSVKSSIPNFYRLTRRILRTPAEGADTIVWLAASESAADETGKLWFDRQAQSPYWLPGTRETRQERKAFWELCRERAGLGDDPSAALRFTPEA